jgi:very-short-patch-repair endonuclease
MATPAEAHDDTADDGECAVEPPQAADPPTRDPRDDGRALVQADACVSRIAGGRRGLVSIEELRAAGLSRHAIASRVQRGALHPRHRGVFSVGHLGEIPLAREHAALLACGRGAALSHRSAAAVWDLRSPDERAPVDVSVPPGRHPRHAGIAVHRPERLDPGDVRTREGLTVTSVPRTITDLAAVLPMPELERLVAEALARRLIRKSDLALPAGAPGAKRLRDVLDDGPRFTRSEAERALLRLVRKAGLPLPRTNTKVAGLEVDALWPDQRLVVEIDGFAFHQGRRAFEHDRRRDQRLRAAGYDVVRITWRQLVDEPERIVALLAGLLAR